MQVCIVFGAGPVGLLCMAVAKALGARRVIAVDINQERLDFAKSYAATDIYLPVRPLYLLLLLHLFRLSISSIEFRQSVIAIESQRTYPSDLNHLPPLPPQTFRS